jgi:hypothetical protein
MAWSAPLDAQAQWSVTDQELMTAAVYRLLENGNADASPSTFLTDMYTPQQLLNALNNRQRQFLKDTTCILTRVTQDSTPQEPRYALPGNSIVTRRVCWQKAPDQATDPITAYPKYSLFRTDTYALDSGMPSWSYDFADPTVFHESALPTLEIEIINAPIDVGTISLMYVALSTMMDGSGVKLTVPDEWAPYIMYGALADLLKADGAGKDLNRTAYCEQRYTQGVEMARLLMEGN